MRTESDFQDYDNINIDDIKSNTTDWTISSIKENLEYRNRYFSDSGFLSRLRLTFEKSTKIYASEDQNLKKASGAETISFYRARNYTNEEINQQKLTSDFQGYDKEGSFVNLKSRWASSGRMNPQGITVLYVASDERTAITELHPHLDEVYSVATIKIKKGETLKIADLSQKLVDDEFTEELTEAISMGNSEEDYVFPQYVASFCKSLGYDGIGYRSKYSLRDDVKHNRGINYTIFNYEKCEVLSSKLFRIGQVSVHYHPFINYLIRPDNYQAYWINAESGPGLEIKIKSNSKDGNSLQIKFDFSKTTAQTLAAVIKLDENTDMISMNECKEKYAGNRKLGLNCTLVCSASCNMTVELDPQVKGVGLFYLPIALDAGTNDLVLSFNEFLAQDKADGSMCIKEIKFIINESDGYKQGFFEIQKLRIE